MYGVWEGGGEGSFYIQYRIFNNLLNQCDNVSSAESITKTLTVLPHQLYVCYKEMSFRVD